MKCNSRIFICYRKNNVDLAKKLKKYICERNQEENLNIDKVWFSNDEVECNYLYDAAQIIKELENRGIISSRQGTEDRRILVDEAQLKAILKL